MLVCVVMYVVLVLTTGVWHKCSFRHCQQRVPYSRCCSHFTVKSLGPSGLSVPRSRRLLKSPPRPHTTIPYVPRDSLKRAQRAPCAVGGWV